MSSCVTSENSTFINVIKYTLIVINIFSLITSSELILALVFMKRSVKHFHDSPHVNEKFVDLSVLIIELSGFDFIFTLSGIYGLQRESFSIILIYSTVLTLQFFIFIAFSM